MKHLFKWIRRKTLQKMTSEDKLDEIVTLVYELRTDRVLESIHVRMAHAIRTKGRLNLMEIK